MEKEIFDQLEGSTPDREQRTMLKAHLLELLEQVDGDPGSERAVAYHIAGLMATKFALSLAEDDPFTIVLEMAGQLELPEHHHGDATWAKFKKLIHTLPD